MDKDLIINDDELFNDEFEDETFEFENPLNNQIGGEHYKNFEIQPSIFCQKNRLNHLESSAIKYITRHNLKGGEDDIKKAIHCLEMILEIEYKK